MKVEFTRAEIERIILDYVNKLLPDQDFNKVKGDYNFIPMIVTVERDDGAQ
jgi:hypothetical protein